MKKLFYDTREELFCMQHVFFASDHSGAATKGCYFTSFLSIGFLKQIV
jgi:hypothetical protein